MTDGTVTILYARASIIIIISIFYIAGGAHFYISGVYRQPQAVRRKAFYALFPKYENRLDVLFFITERRLAPP